MRLHGTGTGAQAEFVVKQLVSQTRSALRSSREQGLRTTQALLDGYSTLVSGVFIGMLEGMRPPVTSPASEPEAAVTALPRRRKA